MSCVDALLQRSMLVAVAAVWAASVALAGPAAGADRIAASSVLAAADDNATLTAARKTNQGDPITIGALLSQSTCRSSSTSCLLLKMEYAVQESPPKDRPPLNIALVLDNSGSMAEARKLPYTLEAARIVIENMTEQDTLALIAFNDRTIVLSAAGRVVNKAFLRHRLEEVVPENYTNLSAGLLEGIAQVRAHSADGQKRHVLLLTDGQANRGATSATALRTIAQEATRSGIGVSTFGVGSEFNERLLADLATAGSGRYVYIGTPEQIPTAFQDELHGLIEVVAQNAAIEIMVRGGEITKVYGQLLDEPTSSHKVVVGDLRAAEHGFVLAQLDSGRSGRVTNLQADVRVLFDDPATGLRLTRTASAQLPSRAGPEDQSIAFLSAILEAVEAADLAAQGLDTERYRSARSSFERLYAQARDFAMRTRDQELLNQTFVLKHFMEELAIAEKQGLLHGHQEARARLQKESHYLRYLLTHHRPGS